MKDDESPYRPPPLGIEDQPFSEPPHSGLGIASLVVGILSGVTVFAAFVIIGVLIASAPDDVEQIATHVQVMMGVGFVMLGALGLAFVGLALAIAALFQPNRKKVFTVLGLLFNLFILLGVCGLTGFGMAAG